MNELRFTKHANTRLTQRSVPPLVIELLLDYGATERSSGAERIALNKRGANGSRATSVPLPTKRCARYSTPTSSYRTMGRWLRLRSGPNGSAIRPAALSDRAVMTSNDITSVAVWE
jgi:hypothetical protein